MIRHAPSINGTVNGSLHILEAENLTFNGNAVVTGDLFVPGTPNLRLNGHPVLGGMSVGSGAATPSGWRITLNGRARLGRLVLRTDSVPLPVVPPPAAPTGTRNVSINRAEQAIGDFTMLRNLTLNGNAGPRVIPPGTYGNFTANGGSRFVFGQAGNPTPAIYHLQRLTLNGGSELRIVGPVEITLAGGVSLNASLGNAAHPEWLVLRIARGGLTLNGNASLRGHVLAPSGTVTLNSGTLTGGVASNRLILNGNGRLTLVPMPVNEPPTVTLAAPATEAILAQTDPIVMEATAGDSEGPVARVVFHDGPTPIGEASVPPFTFAWTGAQPGVHILTARAYDSVGAFGESSPITIHVLASLPYFADFELADGYAASPLNGQLGWVGSGAVEIVTGNAYAGDASLRLIAGDVRSMISQAFAPSADHERVFTDFFLQPVFAPASSDGTTIEAEGALTGFIRIDDRGELLAWDGVDTGQWVPSDFEVPINSDGATSSWLRITFRQDFVTRRWDLYANGRMLLANLGLTPEAASHLLEFRLIGPLVGDVFFDNLYIGRDNPLFTDADRDGIDDDYERTNGMDPALDDREADLDQDGLSNVTEFIIGTSPANSDTDEDGMPDQWEHLHGLDPRQATLPDQDSDGDGLTDAEEFAAGTNPRSSDTDRDELSDDWEMAHGLNPLSPNDAATDPDGDGASNQAEYQAGTDPRDYYNGVLPQIESLVGSNGELSSDDALEIRITGTEGEPLVNAPVTFRAITGGHLLAASLQQPGVEVVSVRTDNEGIARAYVKNGGTQQ